ncbi:hypothetical protein TWF694_005629 [Orbilia ellipsospora]|uniref:Nuc-1 negative regulatory protein preg n=1 Tax=Orbilia ellipsospora TaxID=2528407 RepID=A0AAV9WTX3_9PEZI
MSTMVSPSLSPFSSSSSPPPSPQQVRISQSQQMSPRPQQPSSSRSKPSQSSHASPTVAPMGPPPAPSPSASTSNPGAASVTSPRLKRPFSSEPINPNFATSAVSPPSASTSDYRSSPRSAKRTGPPTLSSASSPRILNSPLIRKTAESAVRTPQSQIRNSQPANTNPNETSLDPLTLGSPSKRARPMQLERKLVPRDYQLCAMNDLVVLISDMLNQLVSLNDGIPLTQGGLTRFHSRAPPTITITDYLHRIALHTTLEPSTLLSMVYYIDLLSNHYPAFTISSLTVHRFLITAATVSSKGLCDSFCTNTFYARVGGISLRELNVLELEFLNRVGWRIVPQAEVLREYYVSLVRRMGDGWGLEEGPESEYSTDELFDESSSGAGSYVSGSDTKGSPHLQAKASFLSGSAPIAGSQDRDAPGEPNSSGTESR